jgi:hypothetical protein
MLLDLTPPATRAPSRGRYDRAHSSCQRFREQHARLLQAAATAHVEGTSNVARVTGLAGVGRNTFYECFDDFAHALAAVRAYEICRVQRALAGQVSSGALRVRILELCRVWMELIAAGPVTALVALEPEPGRPGSRLRSVFQQALPSQLAPDRRCDDAVLFHAAACAEASARALALELLRGEPSTTEDQLSAAHLLPSTTSEASPATREPSAAVARMARASAAARQATPALGRAVYVLVSG